MSYLFFCIGITLFALPNFVMDLWGEQNVETSGPVENLWKTCGKIVDKYYI